MSTYLSNRMTDITIDWIFKNGYNFDLKKADTLDIFKKAIATRLKGPFNESFKKGAKMVNWESVYKLVKNS